MSLEELYTQLLAAQPDIAEKTFYDHIETDEGEELYPPFIFVHQTAGNPFNADNRVYWIGIENRLDIYTADQDPSLRRTIQDFLDSLDLAYTVSFDNFDSELMLYRDSFTIELEDD